MRFRTRQVSHQSFDLGFGKWFVQEFRQGGESGRLEPVVLELVPVHPLAEDRPARVAEAPGQRIRRHRKWILRVPKVGD